MKDTGIHYILAINCLGKLASNTWAFMYFHIKIP